LIAADLIETPCSKITLLYDGNSLISLNFRDVEYDCPYIPNIKVRKQLERYFSGENVKFDFNFDFSSLTTFTAKVLKYILNIPYGKTMAYSDVAKILNTSPRAVGVAMRINPLPIFIPCHRVVGLNSLGGYSAGLSIKKCLLSLEKVDLSRFS
jgi:methylated-DNA-[protein]-cysteine S-methyltransferase